MEKKFKGAEKAPGNLCGSYSKKDSIIRKQSMVDGGDSIPKGKARERSFRLESEQSSAKGVSDQNIKEGGKRTSLPYTSRGFEEL